MPFEGVDNRQQQDIRQQAFHGHGDGVQQGGGTGLVAKIALKVGGRGGGLMAGGGV